MTEELYKDKIRAFIAINVSPNIRSNLELLQNRLRWDIEDIKWVEADGIHITLKFLGNIRQNQVKDIAEKLNRIASEFKPFDIKIEGLGVFPNLEHPRVLWVGIMDPDRNLTRIHERVEEEMLDLEFEPDDREFNAHLTLGRFRKWYKGKGLELPYGADIGSMTVKEICVFKSILMPEGAVYEKLEAAKMSS